MQQYQSCNTPAMSQRPGEASVFHLLLLLGARTFCCPRWLKGNRRGTAAES